MLILSAPPERSVCDEEGDDPSVPRLRGNPRTRRRSGGSLAEGTRRRGGVGGRGEGRVDGPGGGTRRGQEVAVVQAVGREGPGGGEGRGPGPGPALKPVRAMTGRGARRRGGGRPRW